MWSDDGTDSDFVDCNVGGTNARAPNNPTFSVSFKHKAKLPVPELWWALLWPDPQAPSKGSDDALRIFRASVELGSDGDRTTANFAFKRGVVPGTYQLMVGYGPFSPSEAGTYGLFGAVTLGPGAARTSAKAKAKSAKAKSAKAKPAKAKPAKVAKKPAKKAAGKTAKGATSKKGR
jgi:hypothetical protein